MTYVQVCPRLRNDPLATADHLPSPTHRTPWPGCATDYHRPSGGATPRASQAPDLGKHGALDRNRTCNLLIRSQMLCPLSYERRSEESLARFGAPAGSASQRAAVITG